MGNSNGEKVHGTQDNSDGQLKYNGIIPDNALVDALRDFKKIWKDKITVLVCEPTAGIIDYQAHESCCDLISSLKAYEYVSNYKFFKTCLGKLLIHYARESFAEYAVKMGFDYIMFIDDDHIWDNQMFQKLEKYLKDYDIVAPLCVQRQEPYNPVVYKVDYEQTQQGELLKSRLYCNEKDINRGDVITDAQAIGFGCAIIKVDLFKRMERPWFMSMAPLGEDILFCAKASRIGAKIVVDTNVESGHLMDRRIATFNDHLVERAKRKGEQNGKDSIGNAELSKQGDVQGSADNAGK